MLLSSIGVARVVHVLRGLAHGVGNVSHKVESDGGASENGPKRLHNGGVVVLQTGERHIG